jgi:C-lobe and N-lobe beta barrels of Tf-binding protein B
MVKTMADYPRGTGTNQGLQWDPALGGVYNAYRAYSASGIDEELQVWHFKNSYATQYRDMSGGGADAAHQAWSFGGTYTTAAAMPTAGIVNYSGKFGATAKTLGYSNKTGSSGQTVDFNNLWRVNGDTNATANFGTGAFSAVLAPRFWTGQDLTNGYFVEVDNTVATITYIDDKGVSHTVPNPNLNDFMFAKINLKGKISGNTITNGSAQFDTASGLVTNQTTNAMYGGFFGPTANEVTGVFALDAMDPYPYAGFSPINNDRRAYIQMSGIYNAQQ